MLEKKQESQRRGALPRLLLFTFLFAMPVYMCYQLQRGTLAQTLAAVTKQASTIVKQVVNQKNDTARTAALMSLPTTFAKKQATIGREWNCTRAYAERGRQEKPVVM